MNSLQGLLYGLHIAATPANLLAAFVGAFAGTAIGVLPGLGPVAGVALILPLTFSLDPTAGLIMMAEVLSSTRTFQSRNSVESLSSSAGTPSNVGRSMTKVMSR